MSDDLTLYCRCGLAITKRLNRTTGLLDNGDGRAMVPANGVYVVAADFDRWNGPSPGDFLVNRDDMVGVVDGDALSRQGCCGPSSAQLNLRCQSGHDIAIETADCWTPHFVCIPAAGVRTTKPHWL